MADGLPELHVISRSQEASRGGVAFSISNSIKPEVSVPVKIPPFLRKQSAPMSARKAKVEERSSTWSGPKSEKKPLPNRRASCGTEETPLSDPDSVLKELLTKPGTEWTVQAEQILQLRRLVRHHPELLLLEFGHVMTVLETLCNSLRSTVQRSAVQVFSDIFRQPKLATLLINQLPRILELLCTHATLANNFIRKDCESIIRCGIEEYSAKKILMGLLKVRHHNKSVQAQVADSLAAALHAMSSPLPEAVLRDLLPTVVTYLQEASEQTRQAAKRMLDDIKEKADVSVLNAAITALSFPQQQHLLNYASSHDMKFPAAGVPEPQGTTKKRGRPASNKENVCVSANEKNTEKKPSEKVLKKFHLPVSPSSPSSPSPSPISSSLTTTFSTSSAAALSPVSSAVIHDGNTLTTTVFPNPDLLLNTPVLLHKRASTSPQTVTYTYAHPQELPVDFGVSKTEPFPESVSSVAYHDRSEFDGVGCNAKLDQVEKLLGAISVTRSAGHHLKPGCLAEVVRLQRQIADDLAKT